MNRKELIAQIQKKQSYLCVGLDSDMSKIPKHLLREEDPIFAFNKAIIDETVDYAVAYKPNIAFYECMGAGGWDTLRKTDEYVRSKGTFCIADGKRGDIGNTSEMYAKTFFNPNGHAGLDFDALTVAPYMGSDSVQPFLNYKDKWVILLALTSNAGANDFQWYPTPDAAVYKHVLETSKAWGSIDNMMYVVGATRADELLNVRQIVPEHFLLVPGVGAQGGSLEEVSRHGMTKDCGLLVNNSRGIIYASSDEDFAEVAGQAAKTMQQEMAGYLRLYSELAA